MAFFSEGDDNPFNAVRILQALRSRDQELPTLRKKPTLPKTMMKQKFAPKGGLPSPQAPVASGDKGQIQSMARRIAAQYGWDSPGEWDALVRLVNKESGWRPNAQNPTSSAYGLFQFLDSTRRNYGLSKNASVQQQIEAGLKYIADRYKSPSGALNFHLRNNWY